MSRWTRRLAVLSANLALVAVVLTSLALLLPGLVGMQRYVITSGSMTGTYDVGTVVFDRAVPAGDLRVGDVITYQPPHGSGVDHLVTHRLVAMRTKAGVTTYRTRGDANPSRDPWTFELGTETQPRVAWSLPYVGRLFIALSDPAQRRLLIGVPAVLIGLVALRDLLRGLRPRRDETAGQEA